MNSEEYLDGATSEEEYEKKEDKVISEYLKSLARSNMHLCANCEEKRLRRKKDAEEKHLPFNEPQEKFYVSSPMWAYRIGSKYFHSWSCIQEYRGRHPQDAVKTYATPPVHVKKFSDERITEIKKVIREHLEKGEYNAMRIAKEVGVARTTIDKYAKDVKDELLRDAQRKHK